MDMRRTIEAQAGESMNSWEQWLYEQWPYGWLTTSYNAGSGYTKVFATNNGMLFQGTASTPELAALEMMAKAVACRNQLFRKVAP